MKRILALAVFAVIASGALAQEPITLADLVGDLVMVESGSSLHECASAAAGGTAFIAELCQAAD